MTTRWIAFGAAVALALVVFFGWRDRVAREELGKWRAIGQRLQQDSARAAGTVRRTDSLFFRDTVRLRDAVTRFVHRTDSLFVTDTFTVRERIIVATADTVIRACQATVASCQARVAARDSLIIVLGQQREADQRLAVARLRASRPRLLPFVEAGVDPLHQWSATARAGLEVRTFGPVRLMGALDYSAAPSTTHTRALLGVRVTF
jgi:hypothetical protein